MNSLRIKASQLSKGSVAKHPGLSKLLRQPAVPVQQGEDHPNSVGHVLWHSCINDHDFTSGTPWQLRASLNWGSRSSMEPLLKHGSDDARHRPKCQTLQDVGCHPRSHHSLHHHHRCSRRSSQAFQPRQSAFATTAHTKGREQKVPGKLM